MDMRCPGKKAFAGADTLIVTCPACKREIEMFGDEQRYHCRCGQWVFRGALPLCASWCSAAQKCLGEIAGITDMFQNAHAATDKEEQERRLADLRQRIAEARQKCAMPESKQASKHKPASESGTKKQ